MMFRNCACTFRLPVTALRLLKLSKRPLSTAFYYEARSSKCEKKQDFSVISKRMFSSCPSSNSSPGTTCNVVVYVGPLKKKIKVVKFLSISSSVLGFIVQPFVVYDVSQINLFAGITVGIVSTIFLVTPVILNYITKRYVIELIFDPSTKVFTAKTLNLINRVKELKFTAEDVSVPTLPGILSSVLVKQTPLFVDANLIRCPESYSHMMGYDKPFDFEVTKMNKEET